MEFNIPLSTSIKASKAISNDPLLRDSISSLYSRRVKEGHLLFDKVSAFRLSLDHTQSSAQTSLTSIDRLRQKYIDAITDHSNRLISEVKRLEALAVASVNKSADEAGIIFRNCDSEINHIRSKLHNTETKLRTFMNKSQSDFIRVANPLFAELEAICSSIPPISTTPSELPLAIDEGSPALRFFSLSLDDPLKYTVKEKKTVKNERERSGKKKQVKTLGVQSSPVGQNSIEIPRPITSVSSTFEPREVADVINHFESSRELFPRQQLRIPITLPDPDSLCDRQLVKGLDSYLITPKKEKKKRDG
ncbi:hypothetical protein RCL1_005705 [Eukaryota sp. TZLM3-RCL]